MRKALMLFVPVLLAACGGGRTTEHGAALGGRHYGGVFNMNETEQPRGFFPLNLTQASAHRVAAQIYQGLVKLDQRDLTIKPCLAESWEADSTTTIWTFHLREDVRFHDDPAFPGGEGRELRAADIVHCFTALCTGGDRNQMFWLFQDRVLGANEHYAATSDGTPLPSGVTGLEAIDDHTLRIHLIHPVPNFLQVVAHQGCWIWPRELEESYGHELLSHAIGTGPFRVRIARPGEVIVLERNPAYWERDEHGNTLPFLDGVRVTFNVSKDRELDEFLLGHITCLFEPPVERISVLGDSVNEEGERLFVVQSMPALSTQFYGFRIQRPPFDDPRVRLAFSMAIDRQMLVDSALRGLAVAAQHGLVAPGLAGYPYASIGELIYSPDSARRLLALAGYPDGKGFPGVSLQVNGDGYGYVNVADVVQAMIGRELHVNVAVSVLPAQQHYDLMDRGYAQFWRQGWIADYPDAENFLALLYGRNAVLDTAQSSYINSSRYADVTFDSLYALGQRSTDAERRSELLALAEKHAMEAMVVAPLYHERNMRLLQPWVRDFPINAMEYRDLRAVWFDPSVRRR